MQWLVRVCLPLLALGSAAQPARGQDPAAGDGWVIGVPEEHAADPGRLAAAVERIGAMEGVYGVLVVHRGELVVERYFRDGYRDKPHNLKSASKSVLSALAGIAVAEGHLTLDQPIVELLPGPPELDDPRKARITVRHLLTMTSGLASTSYDGYGEWTAGRDWVHGALALPLVAEPGTVFQYSTGNSHLLSAVLAAATGMSTRDYAQSRLFGPLGVEIHGWARDPQGVYRGGNDLSLTPRGMARFGQLFLDRGGWHGRQIVPAAWVTESTRTGALGLHDVYGTYGHLWWTDLVYEGAFVAVGYGGQYIYVSPPHDCVVVVTSTLISKGEPWTAELFEALRDGVLASFAPVAGQYARAGPAPPDPALESLERALERAQAEVAVLKGVASPDGPELPAAGRTSARVNLRGGPGTDAARLRLLERGVEVELLERRDGWLRARTGGDEGWIHADYVELENGSWRPVAAALRHDLAAFSEAVQDRLPEVPPLAQPAAPVAGGESVLPPPPPAELARPSEQEHDLRRRVDELEEVLSAAAADGRGLETELADARGRITALEESLAEARQQLAARAASTGDIEAELRRSLSETAAARDALAGELAEAVSAAASVGRGLEAELADAGRRIAALEESLAEARQQLAARAARTGDVEAELRRSLSETAAARDALAGELAEAVSAAASVGRGLEAELADARGRIAALEESLADARQQLAARAASAGEVETELRRSLSETAAARDALTGELAEARDRVALLEGSLSTLRARQAGLEARLDGLAGEVTERDAALARSAELTASLQDELSGRLQAARARIAALERNLTEALAGRAELEARLGELADGEGRSRELLADSESARRELAAELAAARQRISGLEQAARSDAEARTRLERGLAELERDAEARAAAVATAEAGRQELATRLQAADGRIGSLEQELRAAESDRLRLVAQIDELSARHAPQSAAQAQVAEQLRAADARIRTLEDRLQAATVANLRLNESVKQLRGQWEERSLELAEANRVRDGLGRQLDEARAQIARLGAEALAEAEARAVVERRLVAAEQRAAAGAEAQRLAEAERAAMAELVAAGRQEVAAQLSAAATQIEALERQVVAERQDREALASQLASALDRLGRMEGEVAGSPPAAAVPTEEAARRSGEDAGVELTGRAPRSARQAREAEAPATLVRQWAAAWSSQDAERYLAFYASSFEPSGGLSRDTWEEQRRVLLRRPAFIEVEVDELEVEVSADGETASVRFRQRYRTERQRLSTGKTLELVRQDGVWRIQRELVSS